MRHVLLSCRGPRVRTRWQRDRELRDHDFQDSRSISAITQNKQTGIQTDKQVACCQSEPFPTAFTHSSCPVGLGGPKRSTTSATSSAPRREHAHTPRGKTVCLVSPSSHRRTCTRTCTHSHTGPPRSTPWCDERVDVTSPACFCVAARLSEEEEEEGGGSFCLEGRGGGIA